MTSCPIDDRIAIEDLIISYAHAVDTADVDALCAVFTEDAAFDLSDIGLPKGVGHDVIRTFFSNVFAAVSHNAHYLSNFAVTDFSGDRASTRIYVIGMGQGHDGSTFTVHGRYYFDVVRTPAGWKSDRYRMDVLMPLPALTAVQGND